MFAFKKIIHDLGGTLIRFPIPLLAGVLAFTFAIIEIHFVKKGSYAAVNYIFLKLFLECMSAISYLIAVDIFSESKNVETSKRAGLYILGFCILGLHFYSITPGMFDSESVFIARYLIFISCFHLAVSFAAFYHTHEIQSFWQYNSFLFQRIMTSIAYSLTLFIGLGSAMLAIDKLFEVHLANDYYIDLFLFIFLIFNTILFLYYIPKSYQVFVPKKPFKKSIRIFVQYILIPIVLVYILILYFYLFRIIISQNMPSGWVCIPILLFAIVGILAYLLIYPIRNNPKHKILFIYSKYFFYILLPLLSLYFIAIAKRIMPYGITEDRYLVFMLGVWLLIISAYIIISKIDNIVIIPVSLFLLLFVSAIGPWGMYQLSVQNQVVRLENLLKRNQMLKDKKLSSPPSNLKISPEDAGSIRSILNYLNKRGEIGKLHSWLSDEDQKLMNEAVKNNELNAINAIFSSIEMKDEPKYYYLYFKPKLKFISEVPLQMESFKNIAQLNCNNPDERKSKFVFKSAMIQDTLKIYFSADSIISTDLSPLIQELLHWHRLQDSTEQSLNKLSTKLQIIKNENKWYEMENDTMKIATDQYKLWINRIDILKIDSNYTVDYLDAIMLY